jgi:hypothetical protein
MRYLALATVLFTAALAGSTAARADYALIQFRDGRCEIWQDSVDNPWGAGWSKLAIGLPSFPAAQMARDSAFAQGVCR